MAEGEFYNIEEILDRRMIKGKLEYKIKWEGYPLDQSTWEPLENLETAKELVAEYDQLHPFPKKKAKKRNNDNRNNIQQNENIIQDNDGNIAENENHKSQENTPIDINREDEVNSLNNINENNNDNSNDNPNQDINLDEKKTFMVHNDLKRVITVKQQGQILMAIVEKKDENGKINSVTIPTEVLRKTNPWILLDFYESKIKFT